MAILVVNTLVMFYYTITDGYRSAKLKHSKRKYINTLRARKEAAEAQERKNEMINEKLEDPLR